VRNVATKDRRARNAGTERMLGYTEAEVALGHALEFAALERAEQDNRAFTSAHSH
jgi:hypothetical protein